MRTCIVTGIAVLITSSAAAHQGFQLEYRLEKLAGIAGSPFHINNRGTVTGFGFNTAGARVGFLWTQHRVIDLGTDPAFTIVDNLISVNDRNEVAGSAVIYDPNGTPHTQGFFWKHGRFEAIGDLPGGINLSAVSDINNRGQIAGYSYSSNGTECVIWEDGTLTALAGFSLPTDCTAMAINDFGAVTGFVGAGPRAKPFVWREGTFSQLPIPADGVSGDATDINNRGVIIGGYTRADNTSEALVWRGGQYFVLSPSPYFQAIPISINDFGVMAGVAVLDQAGNNRVAAIWVNGHPTDLNSLIAADDPLKPCAVLVEAESINNTGEIAALGGDTCTGQSSTVYRLVPKRLGRRPR